MHPSHNHTCTHNTTTHAPLHTCTLTHAPLHTCTPTHIHPYTHVPLHTCTPTHMYPYTHAPYTHAPYTHSSLHTFTPTHMHPYTHAPLHTFTPTHRDDAQHKMLALKEKSDKEETQCNTELKVESTSAPTPFLFHTLYTSHTSHILPHPHPLLTPSHTHRS